MIKKILFVCHGNICRSPMAECIFKHLSSDYLVESRAISTEEIGNDIHIGTKNVLKRHNVAYQRHTAKQITLDDYNNFDLIICFDDSNLYNLHRMFKDSSKIIKLMEKDIDDPWYTNDFDKTYSDIYQGCVNLLNKINN